MKQINSVEELIKEINSGHNDFFLSGNGWRSSKYITYDDNKFYIFNEIDSSEQVLTKEELFDGKYTNIGIGIKKGAFYVY